MSKKIKQLLAKNFVCLTFLLSSALSFYFLSQTLESKLNRWSNNFNNYLVQNNLNPARAPIIRVKSNKKKVLSDLYQSYYYTSSVANNYDFRLFYPGETYFRSTGGKDYKICLNKYFQNHIFVSDDTSGRGHYPIEEGTFNAYYQKEILTPQEMITARFGAKGYCFISDTLANKLIEEYGIDNTQKDSKNRPKAYETLITNCEYAILKLNIDGEIEKTSFSINNIIYSKDRSAPRVFKLYGDFCMMSDPFTNNQLFYSAEFDMKSDIYGNTSFLKQLNSLGYNCKTSEFNIYQYNYEMSKYVENKEIVNELRLIDFSSNDFGWYFGSLILFLGFAVSVFFFRKHGTYNFLLVLSIILIYSIILLCVFIAPICNLCIVLDFSFILIFYLISIIRKKQQQNQFRIQDGYYEEVSI